MNSFFYSIAILHLSYAKQLLVDLILMLFQQTVALHMYMSMHFHQTMVVKIN